MNEYMTHSIRDLFILTECVLDSTVLRPEHKTITTTKNNTTVPSQLYRNSSVPTAENTILSACVSNVPISLA